MEVILKVARKKIEEEEAIIPILMMDIEDLENRSETQLVKERLKEEEGKHSDIVQESIEFQSSNMPNEDDLRRLYENHMTKKDHILLRNRPTFCSD